MVWVLAALAPAALIMLVAINKGQTVAMNVVVFCVNPAVTVFSCYRLLERLGGDKVTQVIVAVLLGAVFAILNAFVGLLGGCALGGGGFGA
jgi:hypothetical protein